MNYARQAVTRLTLDMGLPDVQKSISVTRGDTNRRLEVTLHDRGEPFALPPTWTAALTGVLPGGDELYESCEVADGRIIFDFVAAPAVSSEEGVFGVSFDVFDEGGEVVASPKLWVHVTAGARRLRDPDTVDRLTTLQEFVGQINKVNRELADHTEQIHDAEEALGTHGERLSGLEDSAEELAGKVDEIVGKITHGGVVTIPATAWSDHTPTTADISVQGAGGGSVVLLLPKDEETRVVASTARLSANPAVYMPIGEASPVRILRAEAGVAPDKDMTFVYIVIKTGDERSAVAAIIGVDAYGEGGGATSGVDETAVRAIITATLGNVENVRQYSADNPPPYPVTSVNGKKGVVSLTIPSKASDVGADPAGTALSKLSTHNVDTESHQDLRLELKGLADRLAAVLDSDDTTLDELSEIVAYIKSNKDLIDDITDAKVDVDDIIDNLTTNVVNRPLSAAQGVALKALIDGLQSGKVDKAGVASEVTAQLTAAKQSGEFDGEDGKSAYAYAQDGGYAGTEEEFGEKLAETPLVGLVSEITPSQVAEAVTAGRDVSVAYIDKTYGKIVFSAFMFSENFSGVFSSEILQYGGIYILVELVGDVAAGTWAFFYTQIVTKDDIPEIPAKLPNPHALTINGTAYDGSMPAIIDTTPFVITVTGDADSGYTVDKTKDEINAAYSAKRPMVCNVDGGYSSIPLNRVGGSVTLIRTFYFMSLSGTSYTSVNIAVQANGHINVKIASGAYGAMKALTINGITYDGSSAVSMDIAPLVVEITMDESTGEWVSTHPADAILWAYYQGRLPICSIDGLFVPFVGYDSDNRVQFILTVAAGEVFMTYVINIERDTVTVEMMETTSLPNPHALAIGGTTYDGSEAVDITDTINSMIDAKLGVIENGSY